MTDSPFFIGIDAGGTKTIAISSAGDEVAGPGTNLRRDGCSRAATILSELLQSLNPPEGAAVYICAGVAGAANTENQAELVNELITRGHSGHALIKILPDTSIAYYAAHQDRSGLLLITGTGSIYWARTRRGQMVRSGGWGSLLGDEGGGFRLGIAALRALTHEIDGGPVTLMSTFLCNQFEICSADDILDFIYKKQGNASLLAPIVLEAAQKEDTVAIHILQEQLQSLAKHLEYLLLKHPDIELKLSLAGGLTQNVFYTDHLKKALARVHAGLKYVEPSMSPARAALELAKKLAD